MIVVIIPKIKTTKISEAVIETFFDALSRGDIKVGQEIPPEREFSQMLGVSRGAYREGVSILEFLGIITAQGKKKIVVRDAESVKKALNIIGISDNADIVMDFIEFRKVLELFNIQHACERGTIDDFGKIQQAVSQLEKDPDDFEADYNFHVALAQASHNAFAAAVEELIVTILSHVRQRSIEYPGRKEKIANEHKAILDAVLDRNSVLAQQKMNEHLNNIVLTLSGNKIKADE